MPRSLRARLLLLTIFVAAAALAAAGMLSREAVLTEYRRLETSDRAARLADAAAVLEAWVGQTGSFASIDSVLARLKGPGSGELLLLGPGGTVVGASAPEIRSARITSRPNGSLELESREQRDGVTRMKREVLVGGPRAAIRGPDGTLRGTLYQLPADRVDGRALPRTRTGPPFIASVNRWLLLAAAASCVLAILLALALSRRILGPVEALTRAARGMEGGDLGQRVPVRSGDEIGELARAFNSMAESLERNEASRRRLLTDVAHELRSPLTNLRCQIEAVQDGLASADRRVVQSLHEETLLLGRLVDDIQDLSLAEAGRLPLHPERIDADDAVRAAVAAVAPLAAEREIALEALPRTSGSRAMVQADPARLGQVLRNLLANALAHTPPRGTVRVGAGARDGHVEFAVTDSGPGIAAEHLPRVFDRFYRVDAARARANGGAGLGLAIVKQLVEAHGGTVTAESEPGRGATFRFTLPLADPS